MKGSGLDMARGLKLSKELIQEIHTYMQNGMTDKDTCALCGITAGIYYKWIADAKEILKSEKPEEEMTEFDLLRLELLDSIEKGKSEFKAWHVNNIMQASKKSPAYWTASAWLLERKFPDEFGRIDKHNVAVRDDGMLEEMRDLMKEIGTGDE